MSKMRMPEMSVVRFNESDVIVASIATSIILNKFGDSGEGSHNNGYFTINNVNYGAKDGGKTFEDAYAAYSNLSGNPDFYFNRNGNTGTWTMDALFTADSNGTAIAGVDGVYYWSGERFTYPQNQ